MANLNHTCNSTSQESPEFFKAFIRRYSAITMVVADEALGLLLLAVLESTSSQDKASSCSRNEIPRVFQRQFNGMVPAYVILKERSAGRSWHVKLEKLENGLHFTDGWEIFANGLLVCGDFLVFKYIGNYLFHVKIFSKYGCKKQKVEIINGAVRHVKTEGEYEEQNAHRNVNPISKLENLDHYKGNKSGTSGKNRDHNRELHNVKPDILEHVKTEMEDGEEQTHDLGKVLKSKEKSDGNCS